MFLVVYLVLGYWSTGKTIYRNYILIGAPGDIFMKRLIMGFIFGWALIPVAIVMKIFGR